MKSIQFRQQNFTGYFIAMLCAFILTACGGGGGNPGINPNQPTTANSRVTSLVITTSATSIPASGTPGTEVTVTVLARDANNTAVPGATITINADSGAISFVTSTDATAMPGVTDSTGTVTAKLSIAGVATLRTINVTAASGSVRSETKPVAVVAATNTLSVISSSDTLQSSGSVMITVLVRGPSNNVLTGAKVSLISDSGALVFVSTGGNAADPTLTDANGVVAATLTAGNNAQPRIITVTATLNPAFGTSTPTTKTVNVVTAATTLLTTSNTGNLVSSGATGTEVMVSVLARDANNNVMANVPVTISANSGVLTVMSPRTDATGIVKATLGTGGDQSLRTITVNASTMGVQATPLMIDVVGTKITLNTSASVNAGTMTEMTVNLVDSSGTGLSNKAVTFNSTNGGTVAVKNAGMAKTNGTGQLILVFTPKVGTASDTVTVSALGSTDSKTLVVNNTNSFVKGQTNAPVSSDLNSGNINTCYKVIIHNDVGGVPSNGAVSLSSSRGMVFSDSSCQNALTTSLNLVNGDAVAYFNSSTPGVTTFVATLAAGGSTQGAFNFVAPLTNITRLTLQADPAVIGANIGTDQSQKSTIRVVVRDGTPANNVVAGATVNFSIVTDGSGGSLSQPSVVTTGSDGVAIVNYIAGPNATAADGVVLQAQVANSNVTTATTTTSLTVARRALFITAGTGNLIGTPSGEAYTQNYQVLVTDASGNPVPGANITASIVPTFFGKGALVFDMVAARYVRGPSVFCPNEDLNLNGILDPGEDVNTSRRLEPGIPVALTVGGQTDGSGTALVTLRYARDQANWLSVNLLIRATVAGSESLYVANFTLLGLASDFTNIAISPPGFISPYGQVLNCSSQF